MDKLVYWRHSPVHGMACWRLVVAVLQYRTVGTITFWLSAKPEPYRMKQVIVDILYQILIELLSQMLMRFVDWLAASPWL
ncbi:hypothetical protein [Pseudomonas jessenii]|nr:hypothetical protein [Pseudomonas jessenii]